MESFAKIDQATLVRNLNAVCKELGQVIDSVGLYCGPPGLTYSNIEEDIPLALHNIAVDAGWIEEPVELEEDDFESGRADLLGGSLLVEESYPAWLLGLISNTLADLKTKAADNEAAQARHYSLLTNKSANTTQSPPAFSGVRKSARELIAEFWFVSQTVHDIQGLADEATKKKPDGAAYPVSRSAVSRIYNGFGAGVKTRQFVAMVINELIPCHKNDLKGTRKLKSSKE